MELILHVWDRRASGSFQTEEYHGKENLEESKEAGSNEAPHGKFGSVIS